MNCFTLLNCRCGYSMHREALLNTPSTDQAEYPHTLGWSMPICVAGQLCASRWCLPVLAEMVHLLEGDTSCRDSKKRLGNKEYLCHSHISASSHLICSHTVLLDILRQQAEQQTVPHGLQMPICKGHELDKCMTNGKCNAGSASWACQKKAFCGEHLCDFQRDQTNHYQVTHVRYVGWVRVIFRTNRLGWDLMGLGWES